MAWLKLQSAMEYLMTYGWAILLIAVVLGALFELGFFNSSALAPKVGPGSCQVYRPDGPGTTSFINLEGTCNNELPQYVASGVYVTVNEIGGIMLGPSGQMTITGWFYEPSKNFQPGIYLGTGNYISGNYFIFNNFDCSINGISGDMMGISSFLCTESSIPLNDNWLFVVGSYDGNNLNGWICSQGSCSNIWSYPQTSNIINSSTLYIGGSPGSSRWSGYISNVQMYNASLSATDVLALYREGIGGEPIDLSNLVAWLPLNGNANDYSGNQNNGVVNSTVFTTSWASTYTAP